MIREAQKSHKLSPRSCRPREAGGGPGSGKTEGGRRLTVQFSSQAERANSPSSVSFIFSRGAHAGRGQSVSGHQPAANTLTEPPRNPIFHLGTATGEFDHPAAGEIRACARLSTCLREGHVQTAPRTSPAPPLLSTSFFSRFRLTSPRALHDPLDKKKILRGRNRVGPDFPGLEPQSDLFRVAGRRASSRPVTLSREEEACFLAPRRLRRRPRSGFRPLSLAARPEGHGEGFVRRI